jgi:Cft2 family RNA processing exonuclease
MLLTNLTQKNAIGANSYLLEWDSRRVVFDAGIDPKSEGKEALPRLDALHGKHVDAVIVSHAHLDHLGALPLVLERALDARVFMTEPTYHLAGPLLHNSVNVMKRRSEEHRDADLILFGHGDVEAGARRWQAVRKERAWSWDGYPAVGTETDTFTLYEAGHILGSAGVLLQTPNHSLFYTGDVNFQDQSLTHAAVFPDGPVDTLLMETTRGSSLHGDAPYSRDEELRRLAERICAVFERHGAVLIPVFALGKTQEALAALHTMMQAGQIPEAPVHIGGLSWKLTQLYDKMGAPGQSGLMDLMQPQLFTGKHLSGFRPQKGHIYLMSSGMMTEHTLSNLMAQRFLSEPRHGVFFIGYTDPQSPAGRLRDAHLNRGRVLLDESQGDQPILCEVDFFDLTAHAQREDLLAFVGRIRPKRVVLVHGDPPALGWFGARIAEQYPSIHVIIPPPGEAVDLSAG